MSLRYHVGGGSDMGSESAWRDVPFNAYLSALMLIVLLLFMVNPPKQDEDSELPPPGNVVVELVWDSDRDVDLDLWVQAPTDVPVGYSNKAGRVFNLLRDDLGKRNDLSEINLENAYTRGIVPGEYTVNVHYFGGDGQGAIDAKLFVRVRADANAPVQNLLATVVEMKSPGQELTAFRFKLTEEGTLVPGSVHHIFKPLRSQGGRSGG